MKLETKRSHIELKHVLEASLIVLITAKIAAFIFSPIAGDGDLIIMYVSIVLTTRFRQVNKILLDNKGSSRDRTSMRSFDYFSKFVRISQVMLSIRICVRCFLRF